MDCRSTILQKYLQLNDCLKQMNGHADEGVCRSGLLTKVIFLLFSSIFFL